MKSSPDPLSTHPAPQGRDGTETGVAAHHLQGLSALADGEAAAADAACARWRDDPEARRTWHAYHLIGDVMRSDELVSASSHDAAFLATLRERLAQEPVVLAPATVTAPVASLRRRQAWLMPVAAAAGFVVVAGVLVMTRTAAPGGAGGGAGGEAGLPQLAIAAPAVSPSVINVAAPQLAEASSSVAAARVPGAPVLMRDPRLDDYLRAHQAASGLSAAAPGGWLRRVDSRLPQTPER